MNLALSGDEQDFLLGVLDQKLGDLREEIYKTEDFEYKESLKADESLLKGLLAKLRGSAQAG